MRTVDPCTDGMFLEDRLYRYLPFIHDHGLRTGNYMDLLRAVHVSALFSHFRRARSTDSKIRYTTKVPDPILGPKGVRFFLVQRGVFG